VSLSLSADLLRRVDSRVRETAGTTRSSVVEDWLRSAARETARSRLDDEIATYYDSLSPAAAREHVSLAQGGSHAARRIDYDGRMAPRRKARVA